MIQYDIVHPSMPVNGVNPEDCFTARDINGLPLGNGFVVVSRKPHLFPDCPNTIYFSLNANSTAEYGILGALVGRCAALRSSFPPNEPVRIYTMLSPEAAEVKQDFYSRNGFAMDVTEDEFLLSPSAAPFAVPADCTFMPTSLNVPAEQAAFLQRMASNDVTDLSMPYLANALRAPHVAALGMIRGGRLAGECIAVGSGDECEILGIYIDPSCRRQGLGTALLQQCMLVMQREGVKNFGFRSISASQPQRHLIGRFAPVLRKTVSVLPSKRLDRV